MELLLSVLTGVLFASGTYALLRRSLVRVLFGIVLLGHAANLLIFTAGSPAVRANPPLIASDAVQPAVPFADPLPQALILTAIVIGFGVTAFAVALIYRTHKVLGADDVDALRREGT